MTISWRVVTSLDELIQAMVVRGIVFCGEQRIAYALDRDEQEHTALHLLGSSAGEPVAAARMRFLGEWAKLERICVRDGWRGAGAGHALVEYMLQAARERGYRRFKLHAQTYLAHFYATHGFVAVGEPFSEAGIEHCVMLREE